MSQAHKVRHIQCQRGGEDRSHTSLFRNVKCIFFIEIKAKECKILHLLRGYNKEYGLMYLTSLSFFKLIMILRIGDIKFEDICLQIVNGQ